MTVRRHVHDMRGSVYAFRAELDAWAMLEIEPGHIVAQALVANAHAWAGQREKAIGECERALGLSQSAIARLVAACAYAQIGKTEEARRVLEEAESAWKAGDPDVLIAAVHAHLGAKDAAFRVAVVAF